MYLILHLPSCQRMTSLKRLLDRENLEAARFEVQPPLDYSIGFRVQRPGRSCPNYFSARAPKRTVNSVYNFTFCVPEV